MLRGRSVEIVETGAPDRMQIRTVDVAEPGSDEIRIRQSVVGLNYIDIYQRAGAYPVSLPSGLGTEAAGVVDAVGSEVAGFKVGDRVAYAGSPPGSYADYRNIAATRAVSIPEGITDEQAAALLMKGMTVEYLLERVYPVAPGDQVLFYAAAGGVGSIAGQWGRAIGARMIGVAGGPDKCGLAVANGYESCIDRSSDDIPDIVAELTAGAGVPVAYDSVGRSTFDTTLACLAPRGLFVSFGASSGPVLPFDPQILQQRGSLYFTRPSLATYTRHRSELLHSATRVFDRLEAGELRVSIGQRYTLSDVVTAHRDLENGLTTGSSVITM